MGQFQSESTSPETKRIISSLSFLRSENSPVLGNLNICANTFNGELLTEKKYTSPSDISYYKISNLLNRRASLDRSTTLIRIFGAESLIQNTWCMESYQHVIVAEYCSLRLSQELQNRVKNQQANVDR